jgi:hypothetical protein
VCYEEAEPGLFPQLVRLLTTHCVWRQIMAKPRLNYITTASQLRVRLDYDPATGIFTWHKRKPIWPYDLTWNSRYAGNTAGSTDRKNRVVIKINGVPYFAHRLAWVWMTGEWPDLEIDHHDGNPSNNRWSNLRVATSSQNSMNSRLRSDNTSGFKGVYWDRRCQRWHAQVMLSNKRRSLGHFDTPEAAKLARDAAADLLHGAFSRSS